MQVDQKALEQQQQLALLEQAVKQKLSKQALTRFGSIKVAYPEKAMQVTLMLSKLISENNIDVIEDEHLKELLRKLSQKGHCKGLAFAII